MRLFSVCFRNQAETVDHLNQCKWICNLHPDLIGSNVACNVCHLFSHHSSSPVHHVARYASPQKSSQKLWCLALSFSLEGLGATFLSIHVCCSHSAFSHHTLRVAHNRFKRSIQTVPGNTMSNSQRIWLMDYVNSPTAAYVTKACKGSPNVCPTQSGENTAHQDHAEETVSCRVGRHRSKRYRRLGTRYT